MQWWCSAQGIAWEWTWRAYPGIWVALGLLVWGYVRVRRSGGGSAHAARGVFLASLGFVLLWLALDWPVGTLAAGYLASVKMVQALLVALVIPPLLLGGVPRAAYERLYEHPRLLAVLRALTHPLVALGVFNTVLVATHLPPVVDRLMPLQAGAFLMDALWLASGLVLWWPVVAPVPERPGFPHLLRIGYLFVNMIPGTALGAFLMYSELPLYALYELAPPVGLLTVRQDQLVAGLLMKVVGGLLHGAAISIVFFVWQRQEREDPVAAPVAGGGSSTTPSLRSETRTRSPAASPSGE
jgi:putative membrane protein